MSETKSIAFVCLHGSAKSLIAAEYLNRRAVEMGLAMRAFSAGQEPDAEIPPHVVAGLGAKGIDVAGRVPNGATAERLAKADRVVHFGCDLAGVVKPGQPVESWADCPAVSDGFEPAWQYIIRKVDSIVAGTDPTEVRDAGWTGGATGRGTPIWSLDGDPTLGRKVLRQSGAADFPWCVRKEVSLADGFVEVRFRPEAGQRDQAGGVVWRWKDGDNYYVARANAMEDNVSLYHTSGGSRKTIKYVDAPVARGQWHTLRVTFTGAHITVALNGKVHIELDDAHIAGPGAVGVWTKADSVTSFDQFSYGSMK